MQVREGMGIVVASGRVDAERLLKANPVQLASALKPGGMVPELRAVRLKEIAERVLKQ